MFTKISLSGFERFFTAICIAISAINLFISFIVAGYWYGESTVIPYTVLVACNFILLEVVLYSIITGKGPALSFLTCVRIYSYLSSNVSVKMLSGNGDIITRCHGVSGMRPVQPLPPLNLELIREGTEVPGQGCAR